jgi:WD repeat and SOF domain-containing protein 1
VWINPGPAASLPNPHARQQMFNELRDNPWSAPFLNDRFGESVKFKLWNTTEQLDGIPELREHWRSLPLFNSGGVKYGAPSHVPEKEEMADEEPEGVLPEEEEEQHGRFGEEVDGDDAKHVGEALKVIGDGLNATAVPVLDKKKAITRVSSKRKKTKDELLNRIGSTSSKEYDRLTVVLSDMARFVLTHRFGGVYLDADTIFLRDWEELSGWKGAFAYRWSRLEKYNTAVLKMQRNSAIGSFLFKSALANGLDFHPMTISRYTKDASLEGLLLRLPDALFDSAWLNTEYYQRDRPAYPYFKRFEDVCALSADHNDT